MRKLCCENSGSQNVFPFARTKKLLRKKNVSEKRIQKPYRLLDANSVFYTQKGFPHAKGAKCQRKSRRHFIRVSIRPNVSGNMKHAATLSKRSGISGKSENCFPFDHSF